MAFTKLYFTNTAAPYTPATLRGAWDQSTGAITKALDVSKPGGGSITGLQITKASASNNWDCLGYRGVSGPLSAQTIAGTVNVVLGMLEGASDHQFFLHVHIYVTQGDSDTPRGTLLSDYIDSTELPSNPNETYAYGIGFTSAQALSSLGVQLGDRIVVETGGQAQTTNNGVYFFTCYGTQRGSAKTTADDLTLGGAIGSGMIQAGYIEFSQEILEPEKVFRPTQTSLRTYSPIGTAPGRVTQLSVRTYSNKPTTFRPTQLSIRVYNRQPPISPGTIIVEKVTIPAGAAQAFTFSSPGMDPESFTLAHGESRTFADLPAGTYAITEVVPAGWIASLLVSNGDPASAITVADGETITVTVTNTRTVGSDACPAPGPDPISPQDACPTPNSA